MNVLEKMGCMILKSIIIFIIGSVIGSVVESIVGVFQNGYLEIRQGLLYGPFVPVYGLGAVVFYYGLFKTKGNMRIFLFSMILGGITEYIFSWIQEKMFGSVSWDYSHLIFNVDGRTSLLHCIYWGIFGLIFAKKILPILARMIHKLVHTHYTRYVVIACSILMMINIAISYLAGIRNYERKQNIVASGTIDVFLDINYPQILVDKLYAEKIKK